MESKPNKEWLNDLGSFRKVSHEEDLFFIGRSRTSGSKLVQDIGSG